MDGADAEYKPKVPPARKKFQKIKRAKAEKRAKKMAARGGYVYAIANDAMPGLVKIGATTRDPMERLHEALVCKQVRARGRPRSVPRLAR